MSFGAWILHFRCFTCALLRGIIIRSGTCSHYALVLKFKNNLQRWQQCCYCVKCIVWIRFRKLFWNKLIFYEPNSSDKLNYWFYDEKRAVRVMFFFFFFAVLIFTLRTCNTRWYTLPHNIVKYLLWIKNKVCWVKSLCFFNRLYILICLKWISFSSPKRPTFTKVLK